MLILVRCIVLKMLLDFAIFGFRTVLTLVGKIGFVCSEIDLDSRRSHIISITKTVIQCLQRKQIRVRPTIVLCE